MMGMWEGDMYYDDAWPEGGGGGGDYYDPYGADYAEYVTDWDAAYYDWLDSGSSGSGELFGNTLNPELPTVSEDQFRQWEEFGTPAGDVLDIDTFYGWEDFGTPAAGGGILDTIKNALSKVGITGGVGGGAPSGGGTTRPATTAGAPGGLSLGLMLLIGLGIYLAVKE